MLHALAQLAAGRLAGAEQAVLAALRLDPTLAGAYLVYGQVLFAAGRLAKAERVLAKALAIDPELPEGHSLAALVHAELGRSGDAHERGLQGLTLAPGEDVPHAALGSTFLQTGHPFRARRHLREALRLDPSDRDVEQAFLTADRCCRWLYLPQYHASRWIDRLPGKQFGIWGAFLALLFAARALEISERWIAPIVLVYLAWVIYSWIAHPLAGLWVRVFPPR